MKISQLNWSRMIGVIALLAMVSSAFAQAWADAYSRGLEAIRATKWEDARSAFKEAVSSRPEDRAQPTQLPGPVSQRRFWRDGAPYSANFAAAYAGFKHAVSLTDDAAKTALLTEVASEFEGLLARNQHSPEAYYFLSQTYSSLRNVAKQQELQAKAESMQGKMTWRVDSELLTAEDKSALGGGNTEGPVIPGVNPGNTTPISPTATISSKYAIVIGNGESRIPNVRVPFSNSDVLLMREKLVQFAGYPRENIDVVVDATADQIRASIKALADRATPESTIFIYFSGVGVNIDGKDFLAGVDTASTTDTSTMFPKASLYDPFISKGCSIFAFYQSPRTMMGGLYFGMEVPMIGRIAQTMATIPGGDVTSVSRNGQPVGLFTDAMVGVMEQFRSNRIPINSFSWAVFDWMRGSRQIGTSGSGSSQVMTLPVVINLDPVTAGF